MPKLVLGVVHINGAQQLLCTLLVVNELSLRDDAGIQYFVSTLKYDMVTYNFLLSFLVSLHLQKSNFTSFYSELHSPLLEVTVEDSAGEALPADSDALQHTVTSQLVDDQEVLHQTWTKNVLSKTFFCD